MNCYAFEIAVRKAVDALHECTAATKMLRLESEERAALRICFRELRERLLSVDHNVRVSLLLESIVDQVIDSTPKPDA